LPVLPREVRNEPLVVGNGETGIEMAALLKTGVPI